MLARMLLNAPCRQPLVLFNLSVNPQPSLWPLSYMRAVKITMVSILNGNTCFLHLSHLC